VSVWIPTGTRAAFKDLALLLFSREGDEGSTLYVHVPQSLVDDDLDLEWASDDLWLRNDDTGSPTDDPDGGFMVPMTHWNQHVIDGQLRPQA
jgi:hypothetical protein